MVIARTQSIKSDLPQERAASFPQAIPIGGLSACAGLDGPPCNWACARAPSTPVNPKGGGHAAPDATCSRYTHLQRALWHTVVEIPTAVNSPAKPQLLPDGLCSHSPKRAQTRHATRHSQIKLNGARPCFFCGIQEAPLTSYSER